MERYMKRCADHFDEKQLETMFGEMLKDNLTEDDLDRIYRETLKSSIKKQTQRKVDRKMTRCLDFLNENQLNTLFEVIIVSLIHHEYYNNETMKQLIEDNKECLRGITEDCLDHLYSDIITELEDLKEDF